MQAVYGEGTWRQRWGGGWAGSGREVANETGKQPLWHLGWWSPPPSVPLKASAVNHGWRAPPATSQGSRRVTKERRRWCGRGGASVHGHQHCSRRAGPSPASAKRHPSAQGAHHPHPTGVSTLTSEEQVGRRGCWALTCRTPTQGALAG